MFNLARKRTFIALFLMSFLVFGAASAHAGSTHGSDRLVKGAAIGAAIGAVTQAARGRTTGGELLRGAAVGGAVGAAVGAYSDYKQEKSARERAERRAGYYRYGSSNRYGDYGRPVYRASRPAYRAPNYARNAYVRNGRGHANGHRCR